MRKYLIPAIGGIAFVVGGLIARATALENVDKLEKYYLSKGESAPEPASE